MKTEDWNRYERLHEHYEAARDRWAAAQENLRGAFTELARRFDPGTLDENRLLEEHEAHEQFAAARAALFDFVKSRMKH